MRLKLFVWILYVFILVLPVVFAQDIFIYADGGTDPFAISGIKVLKENSFYAGEYRFTGDFLDNSVVAFDSDGNVVYSTPQGFQVTTLGFDPRISSIAIYNGSYSSSKVPVVVRNVSFCDNDGVCEPCSSSDCVSMESSLTCRSDCPSGSFDGFCDQKSDGFCDPDCDGQDIDCPDCEPFCVFDGASCEDLGGSQCSDGQDCIGGYFVGGLFVDGELDTSCCVGGRCGDMEEYVLSQYMIDYHPEAVDVLPENPYKGKSCKSLGGVICGWAQDCDGTPVYTLDEESEDNTDSDDGPCCIGRCYTPDDLLEGEPGYLAKADAGSVPLSVVSEQDTVRSEPLRREVSPDFNDRLSPEERAALDSRDLEFSPDGDVLLPVDPDSDPKNMTEELDFIALKNDSFVANAEDEVVEDKKVEEEQEQESFEASALGFDPLSFILALVGVLLLVVSSVVIWRVREKRNPSSAVSSNVDLQAHIDSLLSQGLSYVQVQKSLVERGFAPKLVSDEIRKNYYTKKRLASQGKVV